MGRPNVSEILFSLVLTTIDLSRLIKIHYLKNWLKLKIHLAGYSLWGSKRAGHDSGIKQQQYAICS